MNGEKWLKEAMDKKGEKGTKSFEREEFPNSRRLKVTSGASLIIKESRLIEEDLRTTVNG